jgi:hypothetical protein
MVMKSRSMRLVGHVVRIEEINANKILVGNMKGRERLEDIGVDGKIILVWIL